MFPPDRMSWELAAATPALLGGKPGVARARSWAPIVAVSDYRIVTGAGAPAVEIET
jgi:hypothetical protein